jgi:Spy/CpxP family protein refolding chaperone
LDLNDDQRDAIREKVRAAMDGDLGQALRSHFSARRQVERLVWSGGDDQGALIDALRESATTQETLTFERARLANAVRELLTEEQRVQLDEMLADLPDDPPMPPRRGRGPRGG